MTLTLNANNYLGIKINWHNPMKGTSKIYYRKVIMLLILCNSSDYSSFSFKEVTHSVIGSFEEPIQYTLD